MKKGLLAALLMVVLVGSGSTWFVMGKKNQASKAGSVRADAFEVIDEAYHIIRKEGVHPVEGDLLIEGALRGMADVIGDPYSTYLSKQEAIAHRESLASEKIGIGAEITRSNGKFIIVAPLKGSPADRAGLLPYDEIIRVDGEAVSAASLQELIEQMRGKKGTVLQLTIYRPDLNKHLDIALTREKIAVQTVANEVLEKKGRKIGYIALTSFAEATGKEWKIATDAVIGNRAEALIIDVRGNPGGYLFTVSEIISSLVEAETIFAFMADANETMTPLVAEASETLEFNEKLQHMPVVLLQDEGSASASEVLSAALQDISRAIIIGSNSFGKGTVQDTFHLMNGGEVKLSTHKWLTPKEEWIDGKGIVPTILVQANPMFHEHRRVITELYEKGDFHEDIAYAQRILANLGYPVTRSDGYFESSTASALLAFQKDLQLEERIQMDRSFFQALTEEVETYRANRAHDQPLQMALDYLLHHLEK